MCRVEGADQATVYREKVQLARKEHKCGECGRTIAVGEPYTYAFLVYDGRAGSERTCQHCVVGQDWLNRECGGYVFQDVGDELLEHARDYEIPALARLAVGMRRRWRLFKGQGLMPVPQVPEATIREYVMGH